MIVDIPEIYKDIFEPYRFKVFYGGRGSGKTETIATYLLLKSLERKCTILCCREYQVSIKNSVHAVLKKVIDRLGLQSFFNINNDTITSKNGSQFIFAGLHNNVDNIKSIPNIMHCWVEEAQTISQRSLEVLRPTIRENGSEILFSFNPYQEEDPIYQFFIVDPPSNALVIKTGWQDNPFFTEALEEERQIDQEKDIDLYQHIWEGDVLRISDAMVLNGKCHIEDFTPKQHWSGPYYGVDWGFAKDPTTMVRCWIYDGCLYIEKEAYGVGIEITNLPTFFLDNDPHCSKYVIRADSARPDTISHLKQNGFDKMIACTKGPNSVEDGVSYLRSFKKIIIHPSCKHTSQESRLYKYKVDKQTGDILPIIVDANNHIWDAVRYAIEPLIKQRKPGQIQRM